MGTIYEGLKMFGVPTLVFTLVMGVLVAMEQGKSSITCVPAGPEMEECYRN